MTSAGASSLFTAEMLTEIKRLQIRSRRTLDSELVGNYRSAFRGSGLVFSDLRQYAPGDDVKRIHWKASARSNQIYVKSFEEDRQLRLIIMLDISASLNHGTNRSKSSRGKELAALLAMLALRSQDSVGLCLFAGDVVKFLPPAQSRTQLQRVIMELLEERQTQKTTNLAQSLKTLRSLVRRRSLVFIISDFLQTVGEVNLQDELRVLALRHEAVALILEDALDSSPPRTGLIEFEDLENDERFIIDSSSARVRKHFKEAHLRRMQFVIEMLEQSGVDAVRLPDRSIKPLADLMTRRRARVR